MNKMNPLDRLGETRVTGRRVSAVGLLLAAACSSNIEENPDLAGTGGGNNSASQTQDGATTFDGLGGGVAGSGALGVPNACGGRTFAAEQLSGPVDIIVVIDNSSSMQGEIEQVQQRINEDFAQILEASGIDYRVIMIARYGDVNEVVGETDHPICIGAPLGASECGDPLAVPLAHNPPRFYHYSADVRSREMFCDVLEGFSAPDELKLAADANDRPWTSIAPNGWGEFLRPGTRKAFVVITDDDSQCSRGQWDFDDNGSVNGGQGSAQDFDDALLTLSPAQFGTAAGRNYVWHSIVAMAPNDPETVAWTPADPVSNDICSPGSEGPGTGFQALSNLTGGLRYPTCQNDNFNVIFQAIAGGVIASALTCEWEIPPATQAGTIDPSSLNVQLTLGTGGPVELVPNVANEAACGADEGWYYDDPQNPTTVLPCQSTCDRVRATPGARVDIQFGCPTEVRVD